MTSSLLDYLSLLLNFLHILFSNAGNIRQILSDMLSERLCITLIVIQKRFYTTYFSTLFRDCQSPEIILIENIAGTIFAFLGKLHKFAVLYDRFRPFFPVLERSFST